MHEVLEDLRNILQVEAEVGEKYRKRLYQAFFHCSTVYSEDEKITFYIEGLPDTIRTMSARYCESVSSGELTFECLIQFAKFKDVAYPAEV